MLPYGSKCVAFGTPPDLTVFNAAGVSHSTNNLDHNQVLILLLVTVIVVLLFSMSLYHVVRRLIRIGRAYRLFISSRWSEDPDIHARKAEETDFDLAMFMEQQWLLSELFSQGHEDAEDHDLVDLPHDW